MGEQAIHRRREAPVGTGAGTPPVATVREAIPVLCPITVPPRLPPGLMGHLRTAHRQ
ncbi:protein of unknown function [Kyrpidia spormannii]|uniref:Uncharacterized protein n=2 Tax=Kyrpidia spormannii TaxID=2055160 RepID=A0ACA8ZCY3_9BACL|nr:protein of unknown function [Kyrpidia spormannii]CAB3395424.1 protein of unknown function [Kyrpidia spormannii]